LGRVDEIGCEWCARGGRVVSRVGPVRNEVGVGEVVRDENHLGTGLGVSRRLSVKLVDVRCFERRGR
jgi:hypothetical protein